MYSEVQVDLTRKGYMSQLSTISLWIRGKLKFSLLLSFPQVCDVLQVQDQILAITSEFYELDLFCYFLLLVSLSSATFHHVSTEVIQGVQSNVVRISSLKLLDSD
jgi:hypothetical protein